MENKIMDLPAPVVGNGIRITERAEITGLALARYYPRRLKRLHYWDEFSRDLFQFKKFYDVALIEKLSFALADVLRAGEGVVCGRRRRGTHRTQHRTLGRTFDIATHPPASRQRLYYPTAHLAKAVAVELDLDLLDCLHWAGKSGSQKKRKGILKLARLGEAVECTSDLTGLRVLLVDDILTTGLTAAKCVEALKFAGAEEVFCAVLGWTISEDADGFAKNKFKRYSFLKELGKTNE